MTVYERFFKEDVQWHDSLGEVRERDTLCGMMAGLPSAFPDLSITINDIHSD